MTVVAAIVLIAVMPLAVAAGSSVGRNEQNQAARVAAYPVSVTVTNLVPDPSWAAGTTRIGVVTWTDRQGASHVQATSLGADARVGQNVTLWATEAGTLAMYRPSAPAAWTTGVATAFLVEAAAAAFAWLGLACLRAVLRRQRLSQWDAEWERFNQVTGGAPGLNRP